MTNPQQCRSDLTVSLKRALVVLLEDGEVIRWPRCWIGQSKRRIFEVTMLALYDRYLVKIVVESRHRRRHTAVLTDIGWYAARDIQRESKNAAVTEESALFIAEVVG